MRLGHSIIATKCNKWWCPFAHIGHGKNSVVISVALHILEEEKNILFKLVLKLLKKSWNFVSLIWSFVPKVNKNSSLGKTHFDISQDKIFDSSAAFYGFYCVYWGCYFLKGISVKHISNLAVCIMPSSSHLKKIGNKKSVALWAMHF